MSSYLRSVDRQRYPRRDALEHFPKRLAKRRIDNEKYNSQNNTRDNSAILKRVINKRYKENIRKKYPYKRLDIKVNDDDYNYNYNNTYENFNNVNYRGYRFSDPYNYHNNLNNNLNNNYSYSSTSNYDNSDYNYKYANYNNQNYNDNKYNDLDVNFYKNNFRNKTINLNNYISPTLNDNEDSNNYDEFFVNYNPRINDLIDKRRNIMPRERTYYFPEPRRYGKNKNAPKILKNDLYNFNTYEDMYDVNPNNNNGQNEPFYLITDRDQLEDYNILYKKRKPKDYIPRKNNNYLGNNYYTEVNTDKRSKRNNFYDYEDNNRFNRSFITNNVNYDDYFNDYYERPVRRRNRSQDRISSYRIKKDYEEKTIKCANHLSQYFVIYYMNVIKKLFNYLKSYKYKPLNKTNKTTTNNSKSKYKKKPINMKYITNYKKKVAKPEKKIKIYENFLEKPKKEEEKKQRPLSNEKRLPYHKRNIIIDRIKSNNESLSPDRTTGCEMYRNINELNKKYDDIYNRKNRMSYNKNGNDLSFTSENRSFYRNSVEKYKEIFENNINKERERKKLLENRKKKKEEENKLKEIEKSKENQDKDKDKDNLDDAKKNVNKNLIEELIKKSEELRKNIEKEIKKKNKIKDNIKNINNKLSILEREKIKKKYGKKNINDNKNKTNDKYEMIDVKKIITRDKKIFINIKYLNHIIMNNKNKNNNKSDKCKFYDISSNSNISLFAIKTNNGHTTKNIKNEKNEKNGRQLTAILEENKLDLLSDND